MGGSHSHHHHHHPEKNIKLAFFLNLGFAIIELIGGWYTNSIAILSDALHDLGDSLTLGVSWYFAKLSKKERTDSYSYGYKRFSVLGALLSSTVLLTGSIFIVVEAIPRLLNPVNPNTGGMILLAVGGVVVNGAAAFRLSKGQTINEKVVYTHLIEDILGWSATLVGAIIMHFSDIPIIDPALSLVISLYILYHVFRNLRETFRIILQGTPSGIDINKIHSALKEMPEVLDMHDCHAWSLDGEYNVLSVHLIVDKSYDLEGLEKIKKDAKERMNALGINHTTIEFETSEENCEAC